MKLKLAFFQLSQKRNLCTNIFPKFRIPLSMIKTQVANESTSLTAGNPKTPDPVGNDYNKKLLITFANMRGAYSNLLQIQHFFTAQTRSDYAKLFSLTPPQLSTILNIM